MRRFHYVAVLLLAAFGACSRPEPQDAAPANSTRPRLNLLAFSRGASVVSRTAERTLDHSALLAIDSDPNTAWLSPQGDLQQTIVYSLPAQSRLDGVGIFSDIHAATYQLIIDSSLDGKTWSPAGTFEVASSKDVVQHDFAPRQALYLRIQSRAERAPLIHLSELEAYGVETGPVRPAEPTGCWTFNEHQGRLARSGAHVQGFIGRDKPIRVEGGTDGRLFRFAWVRGPEHGVGAMTFTADGQVAGITWYEKVAPDHFGSSWYGDRRTCGQGPFAPSHEVIAAFMRNRGRYPLYGLQFNPREQLDEQASAWSLQAIADVARTRSCRITSRELRETTPDRNRARAVTRLTSLRAALQRRGVDVSKIEFVAAGSDGLPTEATTALSRAIYSAVEIE